MSLPTLSPLFSLPAELRNRIYEYVLGGHTFENMVVLRGARMGRAGESKPKSKPTHHTAILRVNRQAHAEASLLLYSSNTFYFKSEYLLRVFVAKCSTAKINAVRAIALQTEDGEHLLHNTGINIEDLTDLAAFQGLQHIDLVVVNMYNDPDALWLECLGKLAGKLRENMRGVGISAHKATHDYGGEWESRYIGDL